MWFIIRLVLPAEALKRKLGWHDDDDDGVMRLIGPHQPNI